jgi:catechol 2,3-dioxygenase-like lactoylglutathione lyase family enzyme
VKGVDPVLTDSRAYATLPAADLERARGFYEGTLGFAPASIAPGGVFYDAGDGTRFFVYPTGGRPSGSHTQMGFSVADIRREVTALKAKGVEFETYDFPGFDAATSIARTGPVASAWFRDSEGNLLGIAQLDAG